MTQLTRSLSGVWHFLGWSGAAARRAILTVSVALGLLAAFVPAIAGAVDNAVCVLVEKEGKVEVARKGSTVWIPGQTNETLHVGDRLRTGSRSRATLRWSEMSVARVSELTSLEIQP